MVDCELIFMESKCRCTLVWGEEEYEEDHMALTNLL